MLAEASHSLLIITITINIGGETLAEGAAGALITGRDTLAKTIMRVDIKEGDTLVDLVVPGVPQMEVILEVDMEAQVCRRISCANAAIFQGIISETAPKMAMLFTIRARGKVFHRLISVRI